MKKTFVFVLMLLTAFFGFSHGPRGKRQSREKVCPLCGGNFSAQNLPAKISDFLAEFFPKTPAIFAECDRGKHEVILNDGSKCEFSRTGEWTELKSKNGVPKEIFSKTIILEIEKKHPECAIVEAEQELRHRCYKFELSDDSELIFGFDEKLLNETRDD